ncbi:carbonic anhydrase [Dysgonomonas sp. 520]|uniref:carbonic anhydrase n=1 Tax=Dysgonomonas sp. 520 TaxID=2302931 RepID=UPI0013D26D02|nr:carbonic anhydrase [Dysgonomonas sp. 520]NDW09878.1 carbonic anhydrase [Dysgonomonas sp. 520]
MSRFLYNKIFEANKAWVEKMKKQNPNYFKDLAEEQNPDYLYIGCSDSRVHANEIMGLAPGKVFVHRNIANMVINTDLNIQSVIHYAIEYLQVKYIIVCGHYNCGGVYAAMKAEDMGILNPWLRNIRDVYRVYEDELNNIEDEKERYNRLVELNIYEQCLNVIKTAEVQKSYLQNGFPKVVGWVYDLNKGYIHDLDINFEEELNRTRKIYNLYPSK